MGRYVGFNYFDIDDDCIATEKMWVSYDAYQNRNGEESKPCIVIIDVKYHPFAEILKGAEKPGMENKWTFLTWKGVPALSLEKVAGCYPLKLIANTGL